MLLLQEGVLLQFCRIITTIVVCAILLVSVAQAGHKSSARDFSLTAGKLFAIVVQVQASLNENVSLAQLRTQLTRHLEGWQVCQLLFEEGMRSREGHLQSGNATARVRHQEFAESLNRRLYDANQLLQRIVAQPEPAARDLDDLLKLLKQLGSTKQAALPGSTLYRQLHVQVVDPRIAPLITPAYQTSTIDSLSADLQESPEAPISQKIYHEARSVAVIAGIDNWDPVDLYEWSATIEYTVSTFMTKGKVPEVLRCASNSSMVNPWLHLLRQRNEIYPNNTRTVASDPNPDTGKQI